MRFSWLRIRKKSTPPARPSSPNAAPVLVLCVGCVLLFGGLQYILEKRKQLPITGWARVVDGDTLTVNDVSIRLQGIDAPEQVQFCRDAIGRQYSCESDKSCSAGERASAALASLVRWSPVTCQPLSARDKYGRVVARCSVPYLLLGIGPPVDLSAALVSAGHALVYRRYAGKRLAELLQLQATAKQRKRGIWQGRFEEPERWRQKHN